MSSDYICKQCNRSFDLKRHGGPRAFFLCEECRRALTFTCKICHTVIQNITNEIPGIFMKRSICDNPQCKRRLSSQTNLQHQVMKRTEVIAKGKATWKQRKSQGLYPQHLHTEEFKQQARERMLRNNPMKNSEVAHRNGESHKRAHRENPIHWKEKYREAKFLHFQRVAEGLENLDPHRSGANVKATSFFISMRKQLGWCTDTDYFDKHPYEFPLVISTTNKICYFPDYYNVSKQLIIEWDERAHKYGSRKTKDLRRDAQIKTKYPGILIIRLPEELSEEEKMNKIREAVTLL